ncbi:uncharacterized protein EV420DRAFT_1745448 [Desarmillaria tabescens]|uniref:Uncharacterized protein n=1 Tax=Armillaria tabescens TaxID=1929756 RepID=A0AA39TT61_ARMTA|nr:uncharacterized protein EV420DRAFT_1745448 [Desarmillaria tabescens]KAK0462854.1 hypothetical protein EV420DRAFT_1745448 [Desarmillaria tabescens]
MSNLATGSKKMTSMEQTSPKVNIDGTRSVTGNEEYFPDILLVNDPSGATISSIPLPRHQPRRPPVRYKRGRSEAEAKHTEEDQGTCGWKTGTRDEIRMLLANAPPSPCGLCAELALHAQHSATARSSRHTTIGAFAGEAKFLGLLILERGVFGPCWRKTRTTDYFDERRNDRAQVVEKLVEARCVLNAPFEIQRTAEEVMKLEMEKGTEIAPKRHEKANKSGKSTRDKFGVREEESIDFGDLGAEFGKDDTFRIALVEDAEQDLIDGCGEPRTSPDNRIEEYDT